MSVSIGDPTEEDIKDVDISRAGDVSAYVMLLLRDEALDDTKAGDANEAFANKYADVAESWATRGVVALSSMILLVCC